MHKGSCLCGAVSFEVGCELPPPSACHCRECRKHSGHFEASADVPRVSVIFFGEENVKWYHSSKKVRRGFCSHCGSTLFWDPLDQQKHDWMAIALGAFDTATNTKLKQHIYTGEKGDYYDIQDGLPQIKDPRKPDEITKANRLFMNSSFHLSIGVRSLEETIKFFTEVLDGRDTHKEAAYANIELFGHQVTLKPNDMIVPQPPDFHFGFNMSLNEFNQISDKVLSMAPEFVHMPPKIVDAGTPMERKKMYLKCPAGYLVELKGYDL